jgi:hypothetical protein
VKLTILAVIRLERWKNILPKQAICIPVKGYRPFVDNNPECRSLAGLVAYTRLQKMHSLKIEDVSYQTREFICLTA